MKYKAIYYSGKTSNPNVVEIDIQDTFLSIRGISIAVDWEYKQIGYSQFMGKHKILLQYGEFPHQYLEFEENSESYQNIQTRIIRKSTHLKSMNYRFAVSIFSIILSFVILLGLSYFVFLPKITAYLAMQIPQKQEIDLGNKIFENTIDKSKIDSKKSDLLNKFARKINFQSSYPLKFSVINENIINAYAIPGGNIVVYDAIIEKIQSESELAALLAHEVSHINKKHSLQSLSREISGSIILSLIIGDYGIINGLLMKANEVYGLSFSRQMETQADIEGLSILEKNHINPKGMIKLMQHLKAEEEKNHSPNISFFSTHPLPEERIEIIQQKVRMNNFEERKDLKELFLQLKQ